MTTPRSYRRPAAIKKTASQSQTPPAPPAFTPRRVTKSVSPQRPWTPPAAPQAPRSWARRHWVISLALGTPAGIMLIGVVIAMVMGMAQGFQGKASMPITGNMATDCLALAQKDNFAPEVCEPVENLPSHSAATTVPAFNDGFRTSKSDDCAQGDQAACQWLKTNK